MQKNAIGVAKAALYVSKRRYWTKEKFRKTLIYFIVFLWLMQMASVWSSQNCILGVQKNILSDFIIQFCPKLYFFSDFEKQRFSRFFPGLAKQFGL